jgi:hypothetical protein
MHAAVQYEFSVRAGQKNEIGPRDSETSLTFGDFPYEYRR